MQRVLVTGGTGFIGRHTLPRLAERGHDIHVVVPTAAEAPPPELGRAHVADLLEPGTAAEVVTAIEPSHLLHMAWYVEPGQVWSSLENVRWVEASLALLRAFGDAGGRRAVLAGTCSEYGHPSERVCREDAPLRPTNLYGESKAALGRLALAAAAELGVSAAWARIFFAYGPFEDPKRLVSSVTANLLRGRPAPCSHGRQVRDYLYTPDISAALVELLDSDCGGPVNVGSGAGISLAELVGRLAAIIGRPELLELGAIEPGPNEAPVLVADVTRLRDEVGWRPAHGLDDGLELTIGWWRRALTGSGEVRPAES
ncbi:MAG: NAD-dependent epimerase/dehydratase family protein [Solirubrobacterales bacterium]